MFWIHGGGYSGGGGDEPRHNGDFLPLKGVVLVTINYRLGVFGFLATSDLAKEPRRQRGNYGLMDMVAALQWVKANIKKFGGDPAQRHHLRRERRLVCRKHADGLAHGTGALCQGHWRERRSLQHCAPDIDTLDAREKKDDEWVAALGVKSLAELRALPTEKILEAVKPRKAVSPPVVDGKVLHRASAGHLCRRQTGACSAAGRLESRRRQLVGQRHDRRQVEGHGRRHVQGSSA